MSASVPLFIIILLLLMGKLDKEMDINKTNVS